MHLHRVAAVPILALVMTGTAGAQAGDAPIGAGAPQIVSAVINPDPIHPGGPVEAVVETSPNVVSVDAQVKGFHFSLEQKQPGKFSKSGTVPKFARFFKGTYHVTFVAHCAGGTTVESGTDVVLN